MTKLEQRKATIKQLVEAIADTKQKILLARGGINAMEDKLESRRAELQHQRLLLKFDEIDQVRQMFSDTMAANQMENVIAQRDIALGIVNGDDIPEAVIEKHLLVQGSRV